MRTRQNKGLSTEGVCEVPMVAGWKLQMMAKHIFREYLRGTVEVIALAESMVEPYIDDVESTANNEKIINQKQEEREKLNKRLHNLIEMRADGEIDRDTFKLKKEEIEARLQIIDKEIENLTPKENTVEDATHEEKMTLLRYYLEQSTNIVDGEDIPDDVIKAFIQKIVAHKDGFDFYLRFTPDDDPKKLNVEGRKDSAKVSSVCELQHRQL